MWLNRFWSAITPVTTGLRAHFEEHIEATPVFLRTVERERARSDRNGEPFSILSYEVIDESGQEQATKDFAQFLIGRVRSTDIIGWFDERHLAILMPETTPAGAQALALSVAEAFADQPTLPSCRIFTYPSDELPWKNGEPDHDSVGLAHYTPSLGIMVPPAVHSTEEPAGDPSCGCCSGRAVGLEPLFRIDMPWWKRTMDITLSLAALILLAPIMGLAALLIKSVSPGPILFRQERVGYQGKIFQLYKFRTMHTDADNSGHRKYMSHLIDGDVPMTKIDSGKDPRLIPFGRLLRKSCIDELPQLINVLTGEMSLIGPRPCLPYEAEDFLRWHNRRFDMVPGITGLWQVNGKNKTTFKQMIRYDIQYGKSLSVWLDLKILLKTVPAVVAMAFERSPGAGSKPPASQWDTVQAP